MSHHNKKLYFNRLMYVSLIIFLITSTIMPFTSKSVNAEDTKKNSSNNNVEARIEPYYYEVEQSWKSEGIKLGKDVVNMKASQYSKISEEGVSIESYGGKEDVMLLSNSKGWVEYTINVAEDGLYEIAIEHLPLAQADGGSRQSVILNVKVNGEYPYRELRSIELKKEFEDKEDQYDDSGNQIRSLINELIEWKKESLTSGGSHTGSLLFYLKSGKNKIQLQSLREAVALNSITIQSPEVIKTYDDVKNVSDLDKNKDGNVITIEAENFTKKNSTSIQVQYDRDPLTTPKSLEKIKFNTLGGWSWYDGGQKVTWEFEVPKTGNYQIAFRGLQNYRKNLSVFRTVYIDGKIPFSDMKNFRIPYATGWQEIVLKDQNDRPYSFYLEKGKHTFEFEVTYEPFVPIIVQIEKLANEIKEISQEIRLASGNQVDGYKNNVDQFRVWNVEQELPGVLDQLKEMHDQLNNMSNHMLEINGERSNVSQAFESIVQDIASMLEKPDTIPNNQVRIGALQDQLESQKQELMNAPLQIDKFYVAPDNKDFPRMTANMFEKVQGMYNSLLYSFKDKNQLREQKDEELNVWMMWGRDYAEELQQLANQQFTPEHGIKVNVNLIQDPNLLILAKAAGIMPDVALGVPSGMPFEMALRGAAKDLSQLPGAEELLDQYAPGTLLPYYYDHAYYGIPETINFKVLFYRKDILDQLNLGVPETWEDVYDMIPTLLQNQYNFYADPKDFSYMLYQNGVELYTPDGLSTGLNTPESFTAFEEWTNLFNLHGMDRMVQSFYQQFRKGTMPIGIADFNQYMQLLVAAPEILDVWGIAPIPGHVNKNGEIVRWAGGTGVDTTSMMMFNDTPKEKQDIAWEFIKWYSSTEVQTEYGLNLEQFRGETFRWNSANVGAFSKMPWRQEDLQTILEQWRWVKDIPNVPGGYMTTRQLDFAWNQTVLEGGTPRIELEKALKAISRELVRKQTEFELIDENGKAKKSLDLLTITEPWEGVSRFAQ
ncbi:extracellular solute-binding protein [Lederbergia wuyishanensis]|uniref:ABC-type glycerol-3-phosphate transport system substrate-binding protein n=1 Tax=Lederbergia wuyishanensis TaxID=1347903 RepID=A0ABU0D9H3_9BACI|nr:extracellular solute-binding protein [Lederbergia wuyishanensis]MCJ8009410.1 extracellular solute-binding protein [Lederbergia wuyishanensis]MDQ0344981.1 ABC-type glycerol-3-phosphate transport system substrate-binding protein [Lederbergia wuyishanensis]